LDTTESGVDRAIAGINARVAKDLQELQVLQGRFKANEDELKKIRVEKAELTVKVRSLSATATAEKAELETKLKQKDVRLALVEANLRALEKEFADAKVKFESDLTEERKAVKKLGSDLAEAERIGRTSGTELAAATQRIQMLDSQLQKMAAIIESSSILTQVGDARLIELGELNERLRQEIERMRSDKGDAASREDFVQEQAETIGRLRAELAGAQEEIGRLKTALETSQQGATKLAEAMAKQPLESVPKGVALDELPSLQGIFTLLAQVDRGPALDRLLTLLGKTLATKGLNAAQMEQSLGKIVTGLQKAINEERANEAARRAATVVSESSPIAPAPETPEQPEV
jgi:chromosome segregation ATPase